MSASEFFKKGSKLFLPVLSVSIFLSIWQVLHLIIGGEFLPSPYQVLPGRPADVLGQDRRE